MKFVFPAATVSRIFLLVYDLIFIK